MITCFHTFWRRDNIISKYQIKFIVLAATFIAWVTPAMAGWRPGPESESIPASISGYYGIASYNMGDLNKLIELTNAGSSLIDPIGNGTEYGGRLTFHFNQQMSAGFSYSAIQASTAYGSVGSDQYLEINAKGSLMEASLTYKDDLSPKLAWGLTGAIGRISANGHLDLEDPETEIHYEFLGSSMSVSANALIEYQMSRSTYIWLEAGLRQADTGTVKNAGRPWTLPDGQKISFSYSGAFLRVGLSLSSLFLEG